jgi:hypothetical protein
MSSDRCDSPGGGITIVRIRLSKSVANLGINPVFAWMLGFHHPPGQNLAGEEFRQRPRQVNSAGSHFV